MIPVVTKQKMRDIDAYMISEMRIPSLTLMENAAFGITGAVTARFGKETPIIAVCGTGNNGGDGLAAARQLEAKGYGVSVYIAGSAKDLSGDAAQNAGFFKGRFIEIADAGKAKSHLENLNGCAVIDALLGTGLAREVSGLFKSIINLLNASGAYIISCDIPSGIDADTGAILGAAIKADETVTFQYAKRGHYLFPGREHTGALMIKEIGVVSGINIGNTRVLTNTLRLEKRKADTHKGNYGKLACVVGSQGFAGAGIMCVKAALRAGAGLVTAGIPASLQPVLSASVPESMTFALSEGSGSLGEDCLNGLNALMKDKTALAAGPGISASAGAKRAAKFMVHNYNIRKVFDADALNAIAEDPDILVAKVGDIVLTPHLGEFAKLCGDDIEKINSDPIGLTERFADKYGLTLLLKGATTIVTNGKKTALVPFGSPGMAKGGSGDVLTGVIASLMCGGIKGGMASFPAALYGAYICGRAGEAAAAEKGEYSMTAMDTLEKIPEVMKEMQCG